MNVSSIKSAIAQLQERCDELKAQGLQRGCLQRISRGGGWRLAWYDPNTKRTVFSRKIAPESVEQEREAHARYLLYKRLQTRIRELERSLGAIARLESALEEEEPHAQSARSERGEYLLVSGIARQSLPCAS